MSDYVSKEEGLFLINYAQQAVNEVETQLKYMSQYIDAALNDSATYTDRLELGVLFKQSMDAIDGITVRSIYDTHRIFPANWDAFYLDYFKWSKVPLNDPYVPEYNSLFKTARNINDYNIPIQIFEDIDNSSISYVNINYRNVVTPSDKDIAAYDDIQKYYNGSAENFFTLYFPCLTVDGLFSAYMSDELVFDAQLSCIQEMLYGPNGSNSGSNAFVDTDGYGDLRQNPDDPLAKIKIWKDLFNNISVDLGFLNPANTVPQNRPFGIDSICLNTRGLYRISTYRAFLNYYEAKIKAVDFYNPFETLNSNLNKVNNSIPDNIRISEIPNTLIDITQYLPQFIRDAYPEAAEFMAFFQDYLNTMYHGEQVYKLDDTGAGNENYIDIPYQTQYDKNGVELKNYLIGIPQDQRISILEKIKRLAELHDPELIDFEFLSHLANALGYKSAGFNLNFNDAFTSLSLGYTIDANADRDISVDQRKYLRHFISNLPSFYRIKSTRNCIKVLLYSFGLIGDIQNLYSPDYLNKWNASKSTWTGTEIKEDFSHLKRLGTIDGPYCVTPHFKILLDLTKSISSIGFDYKVADTIFRAIDAVRPINTVFDGLNGIFYNNTEMEFLIEPPKTVVSLDSTSADTVKHNYSLSVIDTMKSLPIENDPYGYGAREIDARWKNTHDSLTGLTNLPNSGAVSILKTEYTSDAFNDRTYTLLTSTYPLTVNVWDPGLGEFVPQTYNYNYINFNGTSAETSGTLLVCPGLTDSNDATIIAEFTVMSSAISTSADAKVGFSLMYKDSGSDSLNSVNVWMGIRKRDGSNFLEIYRPSIGAAVPEVEQIDVVSGRGSKIWLKVVRSRVNSTTMTFKFYWIKKTLTGHNGLFFNSSASTITVRTADTGLYPQFTISPYAILDCDYNLSDDVINQNIVCTGLTLVGS